MTYADKYDNNRYSLYRFYRDIRRKVEFNARIGRLYPNVLDHVVLDDGDINAYLVTEVSQSHLVDDAAASIQRFASRCLAADKSEMMVMMISQAIRSDNPLRKPILDVLLFYSSAKLDHNDFAFFSEACSCGMNDDVKQAIENGYRVAEHEVDAAIESGNCDTIKLVFSAYRESYKLTSLNLLNATVQSLELLLSMNTIQHGKHYKFSNIPSFSVLQWILDHDVMEHDEVLIDIASNASRYSGHYFDMLRYLIEQRNFTVPRDVLARIEPSQSTDLGVFDYLLLHGADLNAECKLQENVLVLSPMLVRYWIDKGFVIQSSHKNTFMRCMYGGVTVPVLEMMIDKYSINVIAEDGGYMLCNEAFKYNKFEVIEMLLRRGADVDVLCRRRKV